MKARFSYKAVAALLALGAVVLLLAWLWRGDGRGQAYPFIERAAMLAAAAPHASSAPAAIFAEAPSYMHWLPAAEAEGLPRAGQGRIAIQAVERSGLSAEADVQAREDGELGQPVLDWHNADGWIEWQIEVPAAGLYELELDYSPLGGSFSAIARGLQINGRYPYAEAERLRLDRAWKDEKAPYDRNRIGNEIRPVQLELGGWRQQRIADYAVSSEPLLWPLEQGANTIRLTGGREPMSLASLAFVPAEPLPDYAAYSRAALEGAEGAGGDSDTGGNAAGTGKGNGAGAAANAAAPETGWYSIVEAERYTRKSSVAIQTQSVAEPYISPDPKGRIVYNTMGGDRWQQAGDWVEWTFTVPEAGLYALDLKYLQAYNGDAAAYRTIMLDDRVPFRELLHYKLAANQNLEVAAISDAAGEPYWFALAAGEHRLRLIADASPVQPALAALKQQLQDMSELDRSIRLISGNYGFGKSGLNLDTSRTWEMRKYDPDIENKLQRLINGFELAAAYVDGLNQRKTDPTNAIRSAVDSLQLLLEDVDELPNKVGAFTDIQSSLNTWMKPLESQGLLLDYIVVRQSGAAPRLQQPGTWDRIVYSVANFGRTFFQAYDLKEANDEEAITVWVQRGRDYVDLMQKMIERDFTPETGIKVNVNLMPAQNVLMLGNAAGDQPDVALGVSMETPVDFALRGAAADLSALPGFAEISGRFNPGVLRSYEYNGGTYGLPETQMFMAMFYRTDILARLGLEPPDTWEDAIKLLPTLQENGMSFFYPAKEFVLPFYQHGAEFYTPSGLEPQLADAPAQDAFVHWTDLFTKYDLPKEVPAFFNHFRFGDMPIGIADFNTYVQLQVAAPEIAGHWKMAPLPGLPGPSGEVERWSMQGTTAAMLMKKSDKQELAWRFLDWWLSAPVQAQFAADIESFIGLEYRWNTANVEAMRMLPWAPEDVEVLVEQGRWAKNMPYVPGHYFLSRELDFAWNNTVLSQMAPQEALEKAAVSLEREMARKQREFGIGPEADLGIPVHNAPFDRGRQ